ncbi:DMT family transporter [Pukyongiella litopenaei]|uniref:DMT family transporter n=1 Tax=Pukyongiella litopenaei TaxID=2605946 RepID=A0A2S0MUE9_9RHOB|nr:DMT family transporter [Pukyongiella litopenaei]AVO39530.1 DMT family transporter [Pukyongiella litopenaei]
MEEKRAIDGPGAAALSAFALILAFNQVVIKVTGDGFGPVFQAALRSVGATGVLALWMIWRGIPLIPSRQVLLWSAAAGLLFVAEFVCLFIALDLTTVSRASVIFYSMPVWLALAAHLLLPGERLNAPRAAGLALAMGGVALAILSRNGGGEASLAGDLFALGAALFWGSIALVLRLTPLAAARPTQCLFIQVATSVPILLLLSPLMGDLFRAPGALHWAGLAFQTVGVVSIGYLVWFWLLTIYRASGVASFSFLSPVLAVFMGWQLLGEQVSVSVWAALALVAAGLVLINRK